MRLTAVPLVLVMSLVLAACGDEGDPPEAQTTPQPAATTTATATGTPGDPVEQAPTASPAPDATTPPDVGPTGDPGSGETADLPLCSEDFPPCRLSNGTVIEPEDQEGELADLPLCSQGPRPCRDDETGLLVE